MKLRVKLNAKVQVKFTQVGLNFMRSNLKAYKDNPSIENLLKKFETNQKADKYNLISLIDLIYLLKHEINNKNYVLVKDDEIILNFGFKDLINGRVKGAT